MDKPFYVVVSPDNKVTELGHAAAFKSSDHKREVQALVVDGYSLLWLSEEEFDRDLTLDCIVTLSANKC